MALALRVDHGFDLAFIYCLRGELLLKSGPSNSALAEKALKAAIAVASEQGARSYELLASLSLAKLYRSTGSPAGASADNDHIVVKQHSCLLTALHGGRGL